MGWTMDKTDRMCTFVTVGVGEPHLNSSRTRKVEVTKHETIATNHFVDIEGIAGRPSVPQSVPVTANKLPFTCAFGQLGQQQAGCQTNIEGRNG